MDIPAASISLNEASLSNSVQISVMKMAMNDGSEQNTELAKMLDNMAIDTSKGTNIDVTV